jgi:N-acetylmuramoyl-L-alanine amidase
MIVIHCSDTRDDNPETQKNEEMDVGVVEIEEWHRQRAETEPWGFYVDHNGSPKYIGYHYVVRRSGAVEVARPIEFVGCHAKGVNKNSIGVCWIGKNHMNDKQRVSLIAAVATLCVDHGLSVHDIYGHYQFSQNKTCPNFNSSHTFESIDHFRNIVELAIREIK